MKRYSIFNHIYHITKCRKTQSCRISPKNLFPIREQVTGVFLRHPIGIFEEICPSRKWPLIKFPTTRQEFMVQNLHVLLRCKLRRSASSQLETKLFSEKYPLCLLDNSSTSIYRRHSSDITHCFNAVFIFCPSRY